MTDRFKRIVTTYDDHTVLIGRVCRLPNKSLEYDSFHVVTYIGGVEYCITKALSDEQRSHFLQAFELEVEMKFMDQLNDVADAVHVIEATAETKHASEAVAILRSLIELGKRDLSNPKYDSYFTDARELLERITKGEK